MRSLLVVSVALLISGCAARGALPSNAVTDAYSRNFIVATPTAAANIACALPFANAPTEVPQWEPGKTWVKSVHFMILASSATCGAVVGLPFIPASYLCDENPWGEKEGINWSCHRAPIKQ
jgi:hypothetical protein